MRKDIRNNDRVMVDDPEFAAAIWDRLRPFVPERAQFWIPVGLNERFRFYRYDPGQQFDWHFDGRYERSPAEQSAFTFMIYLSGGCAGGAAEGYTQVYVGGGGGAPLSPGPPGGGGGAG